MSDSRKRPRGELHWSRSPKRRTTDSHATETKSDSSRASDQQAIFSDNDAISQSTHTDIDSDSELSTSSEEPSSDSESEDSDSEIDTSDRASTVDDGETIVNVRPGSKPEMTLESLKGGLKSRLKAFIPELKAANQELEKEKVDGSIERRNIEHVDEDEGPYIEMDLGLGVLEEKPADTDSNEVDTDSDGDEPDTGPRDKEPDVLGKLMGKDKSRRKPVQIEEVGEG